MTTTMNLAMNQPEREPDTMLYDEKFALLLEENDETAWKTLLQEVSPQFGDPLAEQIANIMMARMEGQYTGKLIRKLLTDKAKADSADDASLDTEEDYQCDDTEALHFAVKTGDIDYVEFLLDTGIDVDKCYEDTDDIERRPLDVAIEMEDIEIVKLLLNYGAVVHTFDLMLAIWADNKDIVAILLDTGVDANATDIIAADSFMPTPLISTIERGNLKIVEMLIAKGADVNLPNSSNYNGQTPLDLAIDMGDNGMIELLKNNGAILPKKQRTQ